jgi:hypothetical protein
MNLNNNQRKLRLMIAERGINGVLEDLGGVCEDIAKTKDAKYAGVWMERGKELKDLGKRYNIGRAADRIKLEGAIV